MNLGKIIDETSEAYHATEAISHSRLEVFRRRPAMYHKRYVARTLEQETSPAFAIGSAFHMSVLEPDTYPFRYAFKPEGIDRRTNAGKAAYAAFEEESLGKTIIDMDDARLVTKMTQAVHGSETAMKLLGKGEAEVGWRVSDPRLPMPLQCRTDWINVEDGYIVDLKSVDNLDGDTFGRNVVMFGYHRQVGYYQDVLARLGHSDMKFYFIAVEKREPFGVAVFQASDELSRVGFSESRADLLALAEAYATNKWPNLPTEVMSLDLPPWYKGGAS